MNEKDVKNWGCIGGFMFFLAAFITPYIAIIGLVIGFFLLSKAKEIPKAKTHGIIVIALNALAILLSTILLDLVFQYVPYILP